MWLKKKVFEQHLYRLSTLVIDSQKHKSVAIHGECLIGQLDGQTWKGQDQKISDEEILERGTDEPLQLGTDYEVVCTSCQCLRKSVFFRVGSSSLAGWNDTLCGYQTLSPGVLVFAQWTCEQWPMLVRWGMAWLMPLMRGQFSNSWDEHWALSWSLLPGCKSQSLCCNLITWA